MSRRLNVALSLLGCMLDDLPAFARLDSAPVAAPSPPPLPDPDTATCPSCRGVPERESIERTGADVTYLLTICEVCGRTGRVSRDLARALWASMFAAA